MCLPHGLRDMCMIRLRLSNLNEYEIGVIDILIRSVHCIGWCIVWRQAIWWEGMLILNLHKMGAVRTSQLFASLINHIRGWMIYLVEVRWGSWVHLSNGASSGNCSRVDLYYLLHAHHGRHHCSHLLFHGLCVGLHPLLHLLYFAHYSSSSTRSVRAP